MIKAVIFDCFGVLTTEGWQTFKRQYFADRPIELRRVVELNRQMDAALIEYHEGVREIAQLAGVSHRELDQVLRKVVPNKQLLAYIRDNLRSKYRLGILSNVSGNWLKDFFGKDDSQLFSVISLSYESGIVKPEAAAYELIADRLGVTTEESVFIDDSARNITGAEAVGMRTILYKNFEQMKGELERLLAADAEG